MANKQRTGDHAMYEYNIQYAETDHRSPMSVLRVRFPAPFATEELEPESVFAPAMSWWKKKFLDIPNKVPVVPAEGGIALTDLLQLYSYHGWQHYESEFVAHNDPDDMDLWLLFFRKPAEVTQPSAARVVEADQDE
jgi:hypothetical protein